MFCSKCGAENDDQAMFCAKCGKAFHKAGSSHGMSEPETMNSMNKNIWLGISVGVGSVFIIAVLIVILMHVIKNPTVKDEQVVSKTQENQIEEQNKEERVEKSKFEQYDTLMNDQQYRIVIDLILQEDMNDYSEEERQEIEKIVKDSISQYFIIEKQTVISILQEGTYDSYLQAKETFEELSVVWEEWSGNSALSIYMDTQMFSDLVIEINSYYCDLFEKIIMEAANNMDEEQMTIYITEAAKYDDIRIKNISEKAYASFAMKKAAKMQQNGEEQEKDNVVKQEEQQQQNTPKKQSYNIYHWSSGGWTSAIAGKLDFNINTWIEEGTTGAGAITSNSTYQGDLYLTSEENHMILKCYDGRVLDLYMYTSTDIIDVYLDGVQIDTFTNNYHFWS